MDFKFFQSLPENRKTAEHYAPPFSTPLFIQNSKPLSLSSTFPLSSERIPSGSVHSSIRMKLARLCGIRSGSPSEKSTCSISENMILAAILRL